MMIYVFLIFTLFSSSWTQSTSTSNLCDCVVRVHYPKMKISTRSEPSSSTSCTSPPSPQCAGGSSSGSSRPWWPSSTRPPTPLRPFATFQVHMETRTHHDVNSFNWSWKKKQCKCKTFSGLYLWNGIALCSSTASVITWMVQFYLRLTHNVLIRESRWPMQFTSYSVYHIKFIHHPSFTKKKTYFI